jgi:SAM-dependent methyltransferase
MKRIVRALHHLYERSKVAYMREAGLDVPVRYRSSFVHLGGAAEVQYLYRHLVSSMDPGSRILIVGVMGGRDYFLFRNLGFRVTALDLGPQPDIAPIVMANVERTLPFDDGEFDVVLVGEVLEHLREDVQALLNVRRVLRNDGRLIVSVPFFNDWEEGHMRVHSPKSGTRLLGMAGFKVLEFIERPAVLDPKWLNYPIHALSAASLMLRGKTIYGASTSAYGRFAMAAGKQRWWRPLRRRSRHYGGYYLCAKSDDQFDHIGLNRRLYTDPDDHLDQVDVPRATERTMVAVEAVP